MTDQVRSNVPIVSVKNLEFSYVQGKKILEIEKFEVQKNETLFLHGPSGCGKTTLLSLMAGILKARPGEMNVLGHDLGRISGSARDALRGTSMGYIFQMFNLVPYLTVLENIVLPCELNPKKAKRIQGPLAEHAQIICDGLGIAELMHQMATELSVGQQQRVAAARALVGAPELIIADEPTSALDSDHREQFLELLFAQCQKYSTSLVFVSHDKSLQKMFDRNASLVEINKIK